MSVPRPMRSVASWCGLSLEDLIRIASLFAMDNFTSKALLWLEFVQSADSSRDA